MEAWEVILRVKVMHSNASPDCRWNDDFVYLRIAPEPEPVPTIY